MQGCLAGPRSDYPVLRTPCGHWRRRVYGGGDLTWRFLAWVTGWVGTGLTEAGNGRTPRFGWSSEKRMLHLD